VHVFCPSRRRHTSFSRDWSSAVCSSDLKTTLTFLGTSTATPDIGSDTASFVINGDVLVDTGWNAVSNARKLQLEPLAFKYVYFRSEERRVGRRARAWGSRHQCRGRGGGP